MKINDKIHGFVVTDAVDVTSIGAKMFLLQHRKTGASLCYLKRPEESRTFAITFGTPPTDSTGVFHILEHSVLCGSEKFPTKEPFTELLKGSLNTFLNALTYSDRTSYPVSSRNDKDFYNLVSIYLDAVFCPLALRDERIFRQEGWRLESDGEEVKYNGVVYSEMRGDYASVDSQAANLISGLLSPGGTYSHDSGGNPDKIPSLTWDGFRGAHEKHYHPSGAYIFLDGEPDVDKILPLIDSYLSRYERRECEFEIEEGGEVITEPLYEYYEIDDSEDDENKLRVYLTYRALSFDDYTEKAALTVVTSALADTNSAPLKKAVLDSGLCENMYFYFSPGCKWGTLNLEFRGVKDGCAEELIRLFDEKMSEILSRGIDESLLLAAAAQMEFKTREADYGSSPKGIVYLSVINDIWLYGAHPKHALEFEDTFRELALLIRNGGCNKILAKILEEPRATLVLTPKRELSHEREEASKLALNEALARLDEQERASLPEQSLAFLEWQSREDTPEALATIPRLSLSDISAEVRYTPTMVDNYHGSAILTHPICTNGITYTELLFNATDVPTEDIGALVLFSKLLKNLNTERHSAAELQTIAKSILGSLRVCPVVVVRDREPLLYLSLQYSSLDTNRGAAAELALEYLFEAVLDNKAEIARVIAQQAAVYQDLFTESGHSVALLRCAAKHDRSHALREQISGYEFYRWLKRRKDEENLTPLVKKMGELCKRLFVRERLTVALTGEGCEQYARDLAARFPSGEPSGPSRISTLRACNDGIAIPSRVSYAALGTNLNNAKEYHASGAWSTLATLLDFDILWEEVRVKGGAYGTGFSARTNSGAAIFYSYRDPDPARTLSVYRNSPELIRERMKKDTDLEQLIIGTVGALDPVSTPSQDGASATTLYLAGKTHEDLVRQRRECIEVREAGILSLAKLLDEAMKHATATVVGPRETLEGLGLDEILEA